MADSILTFSFFFTFLSLLLHATAIAISPNDQVISRICPRTRNPPFCSSTLQSAHTTDLKSLAVYTLNLADENAHKALSLVQSLAAETTDPELKKRYSSCSANFDGAVGNIKLAQQYLTSGYYNGVNAVTSGATAQVNNCQNNFKAPPADPSSLPGNSKTLEDIFSIVLVISDVLRLNLI